MGILKQVNDLYLTIMAMQERFELPTDGLEDHTANYPALIWCKWRYALNIISQVNIACRCFYFKKRYNMTAYERIETDLKHFEKPVGNIRLYKRVLMVSDNDEKLADGFCLSEHGGFSRGELNKIKYWIEYGKRRYSKKNKYAYNPL